MKTIYETTVTKLGPEVEAFLEEKILVLFKGNAPAELAEYCVLHDENVLHEDIEAKDELRLKDKIFTITSVGSAVTKNLSELGHITLKFDGNTEADLPGTLCLEDKEVPTFQEGDKIEIVRN